jgi:outer membrane autotransporter protein
LKGDVAAKVRPWFTAGIRHQFEGRRSFATAGLTGVTLDFTVPGASRSATLASVSAGVSAAVSTKVEIFAGGKGEFGSDSSGESANLGLRLRF